MSLFPESVTVYMSTYLRGCQEGQHEEDRGEHHHLGSLLILQQ